MGNPSQNTPALYLLSKMSLKRRILLAVSLLAGTAIVDILMFRFGLPATGLIDLFVFILALLIVFRPRSIDRWNGENRE